MNSLENTREEAAGILVAHRNGWFDVDKESLDRARKVMKAAKAEWVQDRNGWSLLYKNAVDAAGNCYSDADEGL